MEKNCRRYLKRQVINRTRCMWMFINIFGTNQKSLSMDKRHGSIIITGNSNEKKLTCSCESVETKICKNSADESEEKIREIIKRLIAQKEDEIQTCKDLLEAFHVLSSEEESFTHEDAQSLKDSPKVEEEDKPEIISKQEVVLVLKRISKFFSKKWKSEERRNRSIVVLKPGLSNVEVDSSCGLDSTSNKSKKGRDISHFLIGLIKRRLHCGNRKKSCDLPDQNCCLQEEIQSKSERQISDEEESLCNKGMSEADNTVQAREDSKKLVSDLYITAKKHLSEMLANGDIDVNLADNEVPRLLRKILSLPEFSSPEHSQRLIPPHDLVSCLSPLSQTTEKPKILQRGSVTNDLIDEDSEEHDQTLFSIDVSVPRDNGKVPEKLDKKEKTKTYPLSSLLESPPSSSVRLTKCKETVIDVQGKLSPVSVLEPLFTDDDSSPTTSTSFSSTEMQMQPLCIRLDEADSPKPYNGNNLRTIMSDKELTLAYIEALVKSAGLSWKKLLTRPFYSEQLLEKELTDDIVFCSTQLCDDKNLLYDCINEVLRDFCRNELNPGPWISFVKPEFQLISDIEIAGKVAQEGVYWHLLPLPSPHSLNQIVRKDMARTGNWMDLRFDIGCIGSGTSEMILDDLLEEIIRSCRDMIQAGP